MTGYLFKDFNLTNTFLMSINLIKTVMRISSGDRSALRTLDLDDHLWITRLFLSTTDRKILC